MLLLSASEFYLPSELLSSLKPLFFSKVAQGLKATVILARRIAALGNPGLCRVGSWQSGVLRSSEIPELHFIYVTI